MGQPRRIALLALLVALAELATGCASSQDRTSRGLFAVTLSVSRSAAKTPGAVGSPDDPMSRLLAANVTVAGMEARRSDGTFVPVDGGFPTVVDLVALAKDGGTTTLPADLLPDGQYTALHVRMTTATLTLRGGARVTVTPPGTGWSAMIPADFGIVTDQATIVHLNVRPDLSFKLDTGIFLFDPEFEIAGIERD